MNSCEDNWISIDQVPDPDAMLLVYVGMERCKYAHCTGNELAGLLVEYPLASHYKIVTFAPVV